MCKGDSPLHYFRYPNRNIRFRLRFSRTSLAYPFHADAALPLARIIRRLITIDLVVERCWDLVSSPHLQLGLDMPIA